MPEVVRIQKNVLAKNSEIAAQNREYFKERGVTVLNFTSSPGSGKTTLLQRTINNLKDRISFAVIEGDQETDNDARKIAETGVPVTQINTVSACHLDADMVRKALEGEHLNSAKMLLIENVGNLVCPASYDLGEMMKIVVMSVTEGEDKPLKYPKMFRMSSALVITKTDLLPHLDFDVDYAVDCALKVNPQMKVFRLSSKTGEGFAEWGEFLLGLANVL